MSQRTGSISDEKGTMIGLIILQPNGEGEEAGVIGNWRKKGFGNEVKNEFQRNQGQGSP